MNGEKSVLLDFEPLDTYLGKPLEEGQRFVDITIDRDIRGWFARCQLCRGTCFGLEHFPKDTEKHIKAHVIKYHHDEQLSTAWGYYEDGARHRDDPRIWGRKSREL